MSLDNDRTTYRMTRWEDLWDMMGVEGQADSDRRFGQDQDSEATRPKSHYYTRPLPPTVTVFDFDFQLTKGCRKALRNRL